MTNAIHMILERFYAHPPHDIDKPFFLAVAKGQIRTNQFLDNIGNLSLRYRRPQHLAQCRVIALRATDGNLIELRALLIDSQNADMPDMVMAASIHAARNIEV